MGESVCFWLWCFIHLIGITHYEILANLFWKNQFNLSTFGGSNLRETLLNRNRPWSGNWNFDARLFCLYLAIDVRELNCFCFTFSSWHGKYKSQYCLIWLYTRLIVTRILTNFFTVMSISTIAAESSMVFMWLTMVT